jgi:hypothetical protein
MKGHQDHIADRFQHGGGAAGDKGAGQYVEHTKGHRHMHRYLTDRSCCSHHDLILSLAGIDRVK